MVTIAGLFLKLPWIPFIMILQFLSLEEKKKMRRLSTWFDHKVTLAVFGTLNIQDINSQNIETIYKALSKTKAKPYGPDIKLKLYFKRMFTKKRTLHSKVKQYLKDYSENIIFVSLDLPLTGLERAFMEQSHDFEPLESLKSLTLRPFCDNFSHLLHEDKAKNFTSVIEFMINKHVETLETLKIEDSFISFKMNIPASFPQMNNLTLIKVRSKIAQDLLTACKDSITSFEIKGPHTLLNKSSPTFIDESFYLIPKLKNLTITIDACGDCCFEDCEPTTAPLHYFMLYNARNLVTLNLSLGYRQYFKKSYMLTELPNLKELIINSGSLLPLLYMCKKTLECLEYHGGSSIDSLDDPVFMPKLTNLYLGDSVFCQDFFALNKDSLEYLYLVNVEPKFSSDESIKMEKIITVLMVSSYHKFYKYSDQDRKGLAEMCPNAKVVFLKNADKDKNSRQHIISLCKSKPFAIETGKCFFKD